MNFSNKKIENLKDKLSIMFINDYLKIKNSGKTSDEQEILINE